ncbi:MAG: O-antigen ligase family protein [Candidatus Obscuribacterales bacterium]|nr:O-antigen ligase family protein [Candidatus Obscuribacterales bacterium]
MASIVSLEKADAGWQTTFENSLFGNLIKSVNSFLAKLTQSKFQSLGTTLQWFSFLAVILLAFMLPLPQFASDKEGLAVIVLAALAMRILGTFLGGKEKYSATTLDALIVALLAANVVATFASRYFADSVIGLAKVVVYTASYFLFSAGLNRQPKKIILVISSLVLSGLLISLYGLYQYKIGVAPLATWEDPTLESKATRIYATLNNPNLLAGYLVPLLPLSFALTAVSIAARKFILAILPAGATAIIFAALLLTGSRGGFIALGAIAFVLGVVIFEWLFVEKPKTRLLLMSAVVLLPLIAYASLQFVPSFNQRITSIFAGREHSSNSYRMNVWESSWQMFLDNWWIGIGPGNKTFRLAYGLYMRSGFDALGTYCVPLEVAVETGIIGFLLFVAIIIVSLTRAHLTFWQAKDAYVRWLAAGIAAAIVGVMAHGLVDTVFFRPQVQLIFWFLLAASVALRQYCRKSESN